MCVCVCLFVQVLLDGQFSGGDVTAGTYQSLKPRLISVLIEALHTETDASNTQIILGQSQSIDYWLFIGNSLNDLM